MALTLRGVRDNIDALNLGYAGLGADQQLKRQILMREFRATGDTAIASALHQQDRLVKRQDQSRKYAQSHKVPKRTPQPDSRRRKDFKTPEGFNACGLETGRSYASRAGERMEGKQAGFPDVMRHPASIGIAVVPLDGNLNAAVKNHRSILRATFSQMTPGAQVEGMFQIVLKTAADLAKIFPKEDWPEGFDPVAGSDEVFGYLHLHCIAADPWQTKADVRTVLSDAYRGRKRVWVGKVQPERTTKDGDVTHGAQGYFEYAALDKAEINFPKLDQKKVAILGHARLGATWTKRNRSFSFGKSIERTGTQINNDRVAKLELMKRLDFVKSNWAKLGAAQRFIHIWFSGLVNHVRKSALWPKLNHSPHTLFLHSLDTVKKWSLDETAQDIDFFDYAEHLVE